MLVRTLGNLLLVLQLIPCRSTIKPFVRMSGCHKMMSEKQIMLIFRTHDVDGYTLMFL